MFVGLNCLIEYSAQDNEKISIFNSCIFYLCNWKTDILLPNCEMYRVHLLHVVTRFSALGKSQHGGLTNSHSLVYKDSITEIILLWNKIAWSDFLVASGWYDFSKISSEPLLSRRRYKNYHNQEWSYSSLKFLITELIRHK